MLNKLLFLEYTAHTHNALVLTFSSIFFWTVALSRIRAGVVTLSLAAIQGDLGVVEDILLKHYGCGQ